MKLYEKFTYLSHCTQYKNLFDILNDDKLEPGCKDKYDCNKVFFKILDDNVESKYCSNVNSIEIVLPLELFEIEKFYFIYGTYTLGEANDVICISHYLFEIIRSLDFDINKFENWIMSLSESHAKIVLGKEYKLLFQSSVIKNRYNPKLSELIYIANELIINGEGYALTVGFLEPVNLKYLDKININKNMSHIAKMELIKALKLHKIKYDFKPFIFSGGFLTKYHKYKSGYLQLII